MVLQMQQSTSNNDTLCQKMVQLFRTPLPLISKSLELQPRSVHQKVGVNATSFGQLFATSLLACARTLEFREMILYSSPTLCGNDTMPQSGSTVKIWLVELFLKLQIIIISFLAECDSMIHLSFDLWTALNNYSMLGIFYHFIDKNFKCHVVLLGMKRLYGAHSSENIAVLVIQTLQAYHLEKRLGFCVMDNATDNDTSLATIEVFLFSIGVKWSGTEHRFRCFGHVINLVINAFTANKPL